MSCDEVPVLELIRGELHRDEAAVVLSHLETCPTCRERARVMTLLDERPELVGKSKPFYFARFAAAAVLVLALGGAIGAWLYTSRNPGLAGELATTIPYPYVPVSTRDGSPVDGGIREKQSALKRYLEGDYEEASRLFQVLPVGAETEFYRGVALYLAGDPEAALEHLDRARTLDSRWDAPARWYRANAALRLERVGEARQELRKLIAVEGEYLAEARDLLQRLPG